MELSVSTGGSAAELVTVEPAAQVLQVMVVLPDSDEPFAVVNADPVAGSSVTVHLGDWKVTLDDDQIYVHKRLRYYGLCIDLDELGRAVTSG